MSIESGKQLEVTQNKLAMLEETFREVQSKQPLSHADELTLESLSRRINKLREEIARFNAHHAMSSQRS